MHTQMHMHYKQVQDVAKTWPNFKGQAKDGTKEIMALLSVSFHIISHSHYKSIMT